MIKHVVLVKVKPGTSQEQIDVVDRQRDEEGADHAEVEADSVFLDRLQLVQPAPYADAADHHQQRRGDRVSRELALHADGVQHEGR